jgi:hypothetical protein
MRSLKAGDFGVGKRGVVAVREPWLLRQQGSRWTIYTFCLCYCGLSCGIFLTDGFRPNNRLPKAPPPGLAGTRVEDGPPAVLRRAPSPRTIRSEKMIPTGPLWVRNQISLSSYR